MDELSRDYGPKLSAWAPGMAAIAATLEYTFELLGLEVVEALKLAFPKVNSLFRLKFGYAVSLPPRQRDCRFGRS